MEEMCRQILAGLVHIRGTVADDREAKAVARALVLAAANRMLFIEHFVLFSSKDLSDVGVGMISVALEKYENLRHVSIHCAGGGGTAFSAKRLVFLLRLNLSIDTLTLQWGSKPGEYLKIQRHVLPLGQGRHASARVLCTAKHTKQCIPDGITVPFMAQRVHVATFYKLLAFASAATVASDRRAKNPACVFVHRDGDFALQHRVAWFLLLPEE